MFVGFTLAGCATTPFASQPSNYSEWFYPTQIESTPSGTQIEVDGQYIGTTPLKTILPRNYLFSGGGTGFIGLWFGGSHITVVEPITIVAHATGPSQYTQKIKIGRNEPAPHHLHFDMEKTPDTM